jgi:arylsulfatase A-like enzyme
MELNLEEPHRPYDQGGAVPDSSSGVTIPPYLPDSAAAYEEMAAFQGAVRQADAAVGRILELVERSGRETLIVFSADHGVAMPRAKCTLYDPGIRTALIVRWPDADVPAGTAVPELVSNLDVLPTILDAAGLPRRTEVQGTSFLALMRGEPLQAREVVYAEKTFHSYYDPMRCVRTARFKYIRNFETAFAVEVPGDVQRGLIFRADPWRYAVDRHQLVEFYDLDVDPLEQHNLAGRPELAGVQRELDQRLWQWMEETQDPLLEGPIASPRYRLALQGRPGTRPGRADTSA